QARGHRRGDGYGLRDLWRGRARLEPRRHRTGALASATSVELTQPRRCPPRGGEAALDASVRVHNFAPTIQALLQPFRRRMLRTRANCAGTRRRLNAFHGIGQPGTWTGAGPATGDE